MKKKLLFVTLLMMLCSFMFAQQNKYVPVVPGTSEDLTYIIAVVTVDGVEYPGPLEIGVIADNGEIRVNGETSKGPFSNQYITMLSWKEGDEGEKYTFKVYDRSTDEEWDYENYLCTVTYEWEDKYGQSHIETEEKIGFNKDGYGSSSKPCIINFETRSHWGEPNIQFDNMILQNAVVKIDGVTQANHTDYELGVFCEGELRGAGKLNAEGRISMQVYGEDNDTFTFNLYNPDKTNPFDSNTGELISGDNTIAVNTIDFNVNGYSDFEINFVTKTYVAKIGDNKYETLQAAIDAAQTGDVITIIKNITLHEGVTVATDDNFTIDLNDKTISYTSDVMGEAMITNKGNLTIVDETGNGKIVYTYTGAADASYGKGNYTISNVGTLVLNGGLVENATAAMSHVSYAIDNNSNNVAATLTINGGKVLNTNNYAVRQVANRKNVVNVNGGEIEGTRAIWIQLPGSNTSSAPEVELNVTAGTLTAIGETSGSYSYKNAVYSYSNGNDMKNVVINISGGTFNGDVALSGGSNKTNVETLNITGGTFTGMYGEVYSYGDNTKAVENITIAGGYFATNAAEFYTEDNAYIFVWNAEMNMYEVVAGEYVAQIGTVKYETLESAFDAVQDGETIIIIKDFALSTLIKNTKTVTLDLNGKTITGTDNTSKNFSIIDNRANLTITDSSVEKSGKMTVVATIDSDWNRYSAVVANNPGGKLTIEAGTIEHLGGTDMAYAIDNLTNGKGTYAETVINGGTIKSPYRAVRQFLNGVEAQNILTINGGTIEGDNKSIFFHDPSKNANSGTLNVGVNASLKGDVYLFVTSGSTVWPVEVSIAVASLKDESEVLSANVPEQYEIVIENECYVVREIAPVAKISDRLYYFFQAAIDDVQDGETIELLADCAETVTIKQVEGKSFIIDGAQKVYSGTINIDGNNRQSGTESLIIKNVNFKNTDCNSYAYFINATLNAAGGNSESHNITVENCTFESNNWHYAIATGHPYNLIVKDCTATNVYYLLYNPQGGNGITVEKCNVTGATYGVGAQKATNVLVKDYTYSGKAAGFYGRATSNDCFTTLENVNITTTLDGQSAVTLWKNDDGTTSDTYIFNFVGENVLTSSEGTASFARQSESNSPYELLLGDVNATLAATEGLNVTTEIAGYDVIYEAGVYKLIDSSVFVAQVKETNKKYFSLAEAYEAAEEGQTVVLLQDVTLNEIFAIEKAITFDGNSFTLTSTAGRAINVDCADAVAINNLTVATTNNTERAINVIQKAAQLTLNNVTAEGFKYTINVATSAAGSTITTNGGKYSGYAAVNIAAGNTTFTSNETEFVGVNDVPQHESNNYAVIAVNAVPTQNVNVNINGGKVIAQTNENRQFILLVEDADNTNITIDAELEIANGDVLNAAIQEGLTLKFRDDYAETLMDQGYTTSEPDTEGLVTVIGNPVARIVETGRYYATIDSAIAAAEAGQTVIVVTGQYNQELTINKAITVDCEDGMIEVIKLNITADGANAKHIYTFNGGGEGAYINAKDVLIEDCVIQGMNGIYQSYASGTVRFSYSYIGGAIYGINFGGSSNGNIIIENCEVAGWTSFASSITNVAVENTTFTTTGYPENDQLRFYQNAQLTNCSFPASMTIDFGKNEVRADFNGCTVENDMLLTDIIYLGDIVEMGVKAYENGELIIVEARVATIENGVVDTENARYFLKLVDAVASEIHDGEIVTVHATVEGAGLAINQDITIDFNGHTYTINQAEGSNGTKSQGFQILPDADNVIIRNGNINIAEGTHVVWMINDYAAELTVENMIFDCQNIDLPANGDASNVYFIVLNNQHGTNPNVTFNNVTIDNFAAEYGYAYYMEPGTQFTAMAGLAIETDPGYEVIYVNGTYYVREIVTDGEAQIGDIIYATFADAYEAAIDGDEIVILKDITFNDIVEISKSITIDINEKTLTGTAQKLFRVFNDVTFENGNIVNNTNNGRCVETRTGDIELNLNNVSLIADNGASQPLTIGGSGDNIIVNVNTSVINAGATGYAVIVFNPVVMNIDYSTVEGWSALYFKGEDNSLGSAGSVVEVNNSELNGVNNVAAQDPSNTFATIQFEDENVTLNVNGDSKLRASEEVYNHQYLFSLVETNNIKINVASGVIFSSAHILICDLLGNAEIIVPAFYSEDIKEEGYWPENYGNDQVIIRQQFIAVASIGETLYQSLEDAYEAAVAGDVIMLLKDVETEYDSYDLTNVTLNLNGKTIYTQSDFVGNNFTITNGTVDGRNASYGLRIAEASDVVIDNINVVGGINVSDASNVTLTNNTVNGTDDYAVMAGENVVDLEIKSGTYYGAEGMDAVFHVGESEVITTGGTYNSNVELAGYCPEGYYAHDNGNDTWTVIRSAVLEVELAQDWNWFSSYVDIDGTQGFSALTNALTGFGSQIKAENGQYSNYNNAFGEWVGSLTSTSTDKMYKIYASQAGTVYIEGTAAQEVEITLYPGLNWIAYPIDKPLNIVDAFRNHTPTNGDQLRTIDSYVEYTDFGDPEWADYNGWYETNGDLNVMTLIPGQGYIYDSKADTPVTFIFNADAPAVTAKSSDSHGYWKVNPHLYPSNMTITAVLNIDGKLAEGNYEIAAFSNGECRGSARAIYVEPLKQYVTMLLVHGDGVENLTFKCYDVDADMVYELDNMIVYSDNARLGSMREPYVFNRNTTGVDENSSAMINIYPNPTTTNSTINLNAVYDKVEVFNSVGVKIAEYANVDNIDPLQTAGVYVIRISNNNDVTHCRLVVK